MTQPQTKRLASIMKNAELIETTARVLAVEMELARREGISLRDIASAAGMSHEQVRRLTS